MTVGPTAAGDPKAARELLRQVRRIELRTRGPVNSRFSGEYHSVFRGHGIEFAEVREYTPGDDVRSIDWNVTARLGRPYIKRFVEERELTVMIVADLSGSQLWGTRQRSKAELLAEGVAILASAAVRNNDRVGLVIGTDRVEHFVPPRKGRRSVLRLVRDLLAFRPESPRTDLAEALRYASRVARGRSIVFVFSDFQLGDGWESFSRVLTSATARHDVVAVRLLDPADFELPDVGLLTIRDPETRERVVLDTSSSRARESFAARGEVERERTRGVLRRHRVDEIVLFTDRPTVPALRGFFARRERMRLR